MHSPQWLISSFYPEYEMLMKNEKINIIKVILNDLTKCTVELTK